MSPELLFNNLKAILNLSTCPKNLKKPVPKFFVLDTSVILYDHNAIFCFEEHEVVLPISVLEELDEFKKRTRFQKL